jgi:alanine-glyoxylate transaminase/serine-glyoxylate transaminase/serine-pyruvate transaminase
MSIQNPVFIPGPTNIPEALRRACDHPTIDHRSPSFAAMLAPARDGVRQVLKTTEAEIFLISGTGTAGWEAALTNTLSPGDTVLAARNGMFSQKWIDMCRRHGLEVIVIETPWGEGLPAARFEEVLSEDRGRKIKAVLATHNETATGVVSDVAGVRRALDAAGHPALFFVDGVSSIGSMDFRMDEWGVDIAVTGSQKGFMLPPGLAILGVSAKARAHKGALPRTYLDFDDLGPAMDAGVYPYTPPVGLINGLTQSCAMLMDEGLDAVFMRHARLALGVRAAAAAWGMELCAARPELYSNSVTAIRTPDGFDAGRIVSHAAQTYGVAFGAGLGEVAGRVFRIGHLGLMTDVMLLSGIATAEMVMADLGLDVTLGSGTAAAQDVFRATTATAVKEAA